MRLTRIESIAHCVQIGVFSDVLQMSLDLLFSRLVDWRPSAVARVSTRSRASAMRDADLETALETSDYDLVRQMGEGNATAFSSFYDRYSTLLFSIAVKILGDVQEAEDALQDALRTIWQRAPFYDPNLGRPSSWASVITRNKAIDRLRMLQRKGNAMERMTREVSIPDYSTRRTSQEVIGQETESLLRHALARLPVDQRIAIELAFFSGFSQSEIATQLDTPIGTIKARIRRGMLTMRDHLKDTL